MNAESTKQIELGKMIGSSPSRTPYTTHAANARHSTTHIGVDRLRVSRVFTTRHACGTNADTPSTAAM